VPPTLARTLRSTNTIESMIEICRDHATNARALAGRPDGAAHAGGDSQMRKVTGDTSRPVILGAGERLFDRVTDLAWVGGAGLPVESARSRLARWDPPGTIGEPGDAGRGGHPHA
jgi:hypothetical protein